MSEIFTFSKNELTQKIKDFKINLLKTDNLYANDEDLFNIFMNVKPKVKKLVKKRLNVVILKKWTYQNITYFIDENTEDVYSFDTEEKIGTRVYDPNRELTYIDFD